MQLVAGTPLDRYVVVGPLGQGGMAHVLLIRHQRLGTLHALKVLHGGSPSIRARLLREGQVQGNLRHTNVLSVTDVIEVDGAPGLVMEYVDGPDLSQLIEAGRLSPTEVDALVRPILDGVIAAHRAGLVHRDLKPANILVAVESERLVPKIADFGLAKVLEEESGTHKTRSGVAMGTPAYMAPEQVRDASRVDARADVFALGCILYELVSGRTAFTGSDAFDLLRRVVDSDFQDVRSFAPGLDDAMVDAIHGALRADPDERLPTAEALRAAWIGDRPAPEPDWPRMITRARSLKQPPAEPETWSGGANRTWTGSLDAGADPTIAPTMPDPSVAPSPAQAPRATSWRLPLVAVAALVAGSAALFTWTRVEPESVADHVLTSTSVVVVVDDPVLQQQFAEAWQAFLAADFRTAERKLEQVTAADPADPLPWFVLGQARLFRNDISDGVQAVWTGVEKAESFDSPLSDLVPHMARVAVAEGWESEHGQAHYDYLERYPTDYLLPLLPLYSPASVAAPEAVEAQMYAIAVERDPKPAAPYVLHSAGRQARGQWTQALDVANAGLAQNPGSPALLARKGGAQLRAGDFEAARSTLLSATQADPGLTDARVDLALTALALDDRELLDELDRSLVGPTTSVQEGATYAQAKARALIGLGRLDEGVQLLRDMEETARAAGAWGLVAELARQQINVFRLTRDLDAFDATLDRMRKASAAPEISAESRQRSSETHLVQEAWLAAARGDLDRARALRDRLAALDHANPRSVGEVEHQIAVADRRPDGLRPDLFSPNCQHRILLALDGQRAGAEVSTELQAAIADPTCSAVGLEPWLQRLAADAARQE